MQIAMKTYEVIDPGLYPAEIVAITPEAGQFGEQLRVKLLLEDEAGTALMAWTSTSFSPKSKLYGLAKAAYGGADFPPGFVLDTDKLIGRRLLAMVLVKQKADGSDYNRIEQFMPLKPAKSAANGSQRQAVPVQPEEPLWTDEEAPF